MVNSVNNQINTYTSYLMGNPIKVAPTQSYMQYDGVSEFQGSKASLGVIEHLKTDKEKKMYSELSKFVDNKTKRNLVKLLETGRLTLNDSNDSSSVLENLYKIKTQPRLDGFNAKTVLKETIATITNPFIVTQSFGDIPEHLSEYVLTRAKKVRAYNLQKEDNLVNMHPTQQSTSKELSRNDINVISSGACVAASMEFYMADKNPAEFTRFAQGLTSKNVEVKSIIDYKNISPNMLESIDILNQFGVKSKAINYEQLEVTLKPDTNAELKAQIQSRYKDKGERSLIDVLMQSTFMQLGSENTYNTLTDKRYGKFNPNEKGLTEFEKNFSEAVVFNEAKTSVTYQNVDDEARLVGYNFDDATVKKHLLDTLALKKNIIIGITETDDDNKIICGHEITVIGTKKDRNGDLFFICNDTDNGYVGPIMIKSEDLIPKIHHAGIPDEVLIGLEEINPGMELVKQYESGYVGIRA